MRFEQSESLITQDRSLAQHNALPSQQDMRDFFDTRSSKPTEPAFLDFNAPIAGLADKVDEHRHYQKNDNDLAGWLKDLMRHEGMQIVETSIADGKKIAEKAVARCARVADSVNTAFTSNEKESKFKPFTDTGKTMDPSKPNSWTLPTKENYAGWMPGDPINVLTWHDESSRYIQEIMKQNFVIDSHGKRVSIFDLDDPLFKARFGNAVRHAIGIGDLVFHEGMTPKDALTGMGWHEPQSLVSGLIQSALARSSKPYEHNAKDSAIDVANNRYAVQEISKFHGFDSFARQMLTDGWNSAKKGTDDIGVPLGTK